MSASTVIGKVEGSTWKTALTSSAPACLAKYKITEPQAAQNRPDVEKDLKWRTMSTSTVAMIEKNPKNIATANAKRTWL